MNLSNRNILPLFPGLSFVSGFNAFQLLPLWEELIASPILDVIKSNYQKYIQSLLKTKQTEDAIRQKATKKFNAPK